MNLRKTIYGWKAISYFDMEEIGNKKFLEICTMKRHNGELSTFSSVNTKTEMGYTHMLFQDFNKCYLSEKTRCTEKSVKMQHEKALEMLDFIKSKAIEHYLKNEVYA